MGAYSIVSVAQQSTAVVKSSVEFAGLPDAERSARSKIEAAIPKLEAGPIGGSFTLCRMPKDGRMYMEPGVIVARTFDKIGDVVPSQLPGGRAVRRVLTGPFDQLPQAWPALFAWCTKKGLKLQGAFWQVYGPITADPAKQETTLYALLA